MNKKSIIFLDVDGVLNSLRTGWYSFDMYTINWLIWFAEESNSQFVISSTWRNSHDRSFFADILTDKLVHLDWKTIALNESMCRGKEIKIWLDKHIETDRYIIFDDDSDMLDEQKINFIQTDAMNGITFRNMDDAQTLFGFNKYFQHNEMKHQHPIMFGENWYFNVYRKSQQEINE